MSKDVYKEFIFTLWIHFCHNNIKKIKYIYIISVLDFFTVCVIDLTILNKHNENFFLYYVNLSFFHV